MKLAVHSILIAALLGSATGWAAAATAVEVFKSPYCGCCGGLNQTHAKNGFEVTTHNVSDVPAERKKLGMVAGSPGMESDEKPEHYDTLLVHTDGTTRIFARH